MYVYLITIKGDFSYDTPKKVDEGILDWKKISWLLEDKNFGVGEMLPHFLPTILNDEKKYNHFCVLENAKITKYELKELITN